MIFKHRQTVEKLHSKEVLIKHYLLQVMLPDTKAQVKAESSNFQK